MFLLNPKGTNSNLCIKCTFRKCRGRAGSYDGYWKALEGQTVKAGLPLLETDRDDKVSCRETVSHARWFCQLTTGNTGPGKPLPGNRPTSFTIQEVLLDPLLF